MFHAGQILFGDQFLINNKKMIIIAPSGKYMNLIDSLNIDCSNMGAWDVYVSLVFPLCVKNQKYSKDILNKNVI
jgi:hypothetical protein